MKTILKRILPAALLLLISAAAYAEGWTEHYDDAVQQAQTDDKAILLNFTGSDWCPWCKKMEIETLSKPEFKEYAQDNLELVMLDFPNARHQSSSIVAQNKKLQQKYKVDGFPTFILLSKDGKVLWKQVGYLEGGSQAFLGQLRKHYHHSGGASTGAGDDFDAFFNNKPGQSPTP